MNLKKLYNVISLNPNDPAYLTMLSAFPPKTFVHQFTIVNEGQRPNVGLFLVDGQLTLKGNDGIQVISPNGAIGLKELINGKKMPFTITIESNSKVCLLDKVLLKEVLKKNKDLAKYLYTNPDKILEASDD